MKMKANIVVKVNIQVWISIEENLQSWFFNQTIPQTTKIDAYVKHHNDISTPHYVILLFFIIISSKNYSTKQGTKYLLQSRVPSLTHGGLHVNNVSTSKRRQYFYHLEKCFFGSFWVSFILIQISFFFKFCVFIFWIA